jgi:EmrB/QacA subfamily drug resistance transporter
MSQPYPRHAVFAALAAVFLGAVDLTVIATVLPSMVIDLGINTADLDRYIWVVNAYLLAYVVAIPIMGRVSDLVGRRGAFELALAVFVAGSVWCALADDLATLIAARTLQGAGGGALLPVAMALVGDLFPPGRRLPAIGLVGAFDTLGWVLGPIWGAVVVHILAGRGEPWRWIFWLNLPLSIAVAIGIRLSVPGRTRSDRSLLHALARLDLVGMALLLAGMTSLNLGLSAGGEFGTPTGGGLRAFGGTHNPLADHISLLITAGIIILIAFVFWEARARFPAIPLQLLRRRVFAAAIFANLLIGGALIVAVVDIPVVVALLVEPERISSISALLLAPFTITMAILALGGGILARRIGTRVVMAGGLVAIIIGYGALWLGLHDHHYVGMTPGLLVAGMGFGAIIAPLTTIAIDEAPVRDRGIAAGLTVVSRLLGMTLGMSALTAFGVRRLQELTARSDTIVQRPGESTADFLLRQNAFIQNVAIPLSVQVVRETFLLAAVIALIALLPAWWMTTFRSRESKSP